MIQFAKKLVHHRKFIVFLAFILLIPSTIGIVKTRINYDILSYLPDSLETVKGQDIMVDQFGAGAYSMIIVEDMNLHDVQKLKQKLEKVNHVDKIIWYDDIADLSVPKEMLPEKVRKVFFNKNATMMIAMFKETTSSDNTMEAVTQMRKIVGKQCFISGMSGVVTDIKNLVMQEIPIYVTIAAVLSLIVLFVTMESFAVAFLFLLSIGMAILYNLGTNIFLSDVSYLTMALTAILQLGVTMDYSIFLLHSYESNKIRFEGDKERAMAHAISNTFKSITGSSVTTVAGFAALCFMTFALGRDLGIVMAKGVVIGVICCITTLPAMILVFDGVIEKTKHKPLVKSLDKASGFITKHYKVWLLVFLVMLYPAVYGNNHTQIYYNIDKSLPATLDSNVSNEKLKEDFDMSTVHMILLKNGMDSKEKTQMLDQIDGFLELPFLELHLARQIAIVAAAKQIHVLLQHHLGFGEGDGVAVGVQADDVAALQNTRLAGLKIAVVVPGAVVAAAVGDAPLTVRKADGELVVADVVAAQHVLALGAAPKAVAARGQRDALLIAQLGDQNYDLARHGAPPYQWNSAPQNGTNFIAAPPMRSVSPPVSGWGVSTASPPR